MALNKKWLQICLALFCFKNDPKNVFWNSAESRISGHLQTQSSQIYLFYY